MKILSINYSSFYYINSAFQFFSLEEDNYNKLVCIFPKEKTGKSSKFFETAIVSLLNFKNSFITRSLSHYQQEKNAVMSI